MADSNVIAEGSISQPRSSVVTPKRRLHFDMKQFVSLSVTFLR